MRNQDRYAASGWSQVAQGGGGQVAGQVEGGVNSLHHTIAFPHGNSRLSAENRSSVEFSLSDFKSFHVFDLIKRYHAKQSNVLLFSETKSSL